MSLWPGACQVGYTSQPLCLGESACFWNPGLGLQACTPMLNLFLWVPGSYSGPYAGMASTFTAKLFSVLHHFILIWLIYFIQMITAYLHLYVYTRMCVDIKASRHMTAL